MTWGRLFVDMNFLDFEQPIAELEAKINELRLISSGNGIDIAEEIEKLDKQNLQLTKSIFAKLKPIQIVQLARHPQRPYFSDYVRRIFTDFDELSGDRQTSDGRLLVIKKGVKPVKKLNAILVCHDQKIIVRHCGL
jgi:acetyl-CoA carboxylase carboxyl transferase subunit alpha